MKAIQILKIMLMLTGFVCVAMAFSPSYSSECLNTSATGNCGSGRLNEGDERAEQVRAIKAAINANLADPQRWKDKGCELQLSFASNGMLVKLLTGGGDKAYCRALMNAAGKAKFPAFAHPELFNEFKNTKLDMRG